MQVHTRQWSQSLALALSLSVIVACGDDDTSDDSAQAGTTAAGKGGGGGAKAGAGGASGSKAGTGGTKAGAGGASGSAPAGMFMCLEEPSKDAVKCGGETCTPPSFGMNTCIVACCVQEGGKEICGAKSTAAMGLATECSGPVKADPACPKVDDGMGGMLDGCCNAKQKKCGIISSLRPSCVTESMLVTLPSPLQDCSGGSEGADAGSPDAG